MAVAFAEINQCGSFNIGQKSALIKTFRSNGVTKTTAPVVLTDSTGGAASGTLAAITAGASYAQADLTAIKNGLASLNTQINAMRTALITAGVLA